MIGLMRLSGVPTRKHPYHPFPVHSLGGVFPVKSFNLNHDALRLNSGDFTPNVTSSGSQESFTEFVRLQCLKY